MCRAFVPNIQHTAHEMINSRFCFTSSSYSVIYDTIYRCIYYEDPGKYLTSRGGKPRSDSVTLVQLQFCACLKCEVYIYANRHFLSIGISSAAETME